MKSEELLDKMDLIDEKTVQEALDYGASGSRKKKVLISVLAAAAALILTVGTAVGVRQIVKGRVWEEKYETRYVSNDAETVAELTDELLVNKPWEEMTMPERYNEISWRGLFYSIRTIISPERAGEKIADIDVTGTHPFTGEEHTTTAEIYHFNGYDDNAAVLVRFAESPEYFAAVCPAYKPATLGDYLAGINAEEALLVPGIVEYVYYDSSNNVHRITFEGLTKEWLMSYFAKYAKVPAETLMEILQKDNANNISYMSCRVAEEEFSRENGIFYANFWFTKTGYMATNILDAGHAFYVGEEGVKEFENYLKDNLKGYEDIVRPGPDIKTPETAEENGVETAVD